MLSMVKIKIIIVNVMLIFILNFSFDAILLIYVNKISSPPIIIKNVIIGNHEELVDLFINMIIIVVWISNEIPIDIGFFNIKLIIDVIIVIFIIINFISVSILFKI